MAVSPSASEAGADIVERIINVEYQGVCVARQPPAWLLEQQQ